MKRSNIILIILSVLFVLLIVFIKLHIINVFDEFVYKIITYKMTNTLTTINKIITFLGSTKFIVGLVLFFFILFIVLNKNMYGYIISACLIISTIFNNLVKIIIRRPRPHVLALAVEKSFSFPSGHMMAAVSMYGILLYLIYKSSINKKYKVILGVILGVLPILIGISRIYLGVHFASDIIGGSLLSIILLIIETKIINKYKLLKK